MQLPLFAATVPLAAIPVGGRFVYDHGTGTSIGTVTGQHPNGTDFTLATHRGYQFATATHHTNERVQPL